MKNVNQPLLYPKGSIVTRERGREIFDMPPVNNDDSKKLTRNGIDESLNMPDEEEIIHITDELFINNIKKTSYHSF